MNRQPSNRLQRLWAAAVLLFGLFSASTAAAQTVLLNPPELYLGATVGANASRVMFNPSVAQTYLGGYTGGLSVRYVTERHFGLQVEVNYAQRGWKEADAVYARRLNYVEMPFLMHAYLGERHRLFLNLGPKVSYLLNESVAADNSAASSTAEQHLLPAHFRLDYGACLGVGYNLHTRRAGLFQLELRAYYGLSDVFPNKKSDYFGMSNNLNASVSLGWYVQLTGKRQHPTPPTHRTRK